MAGKGNPNGVPNSKATQFKKGQVSNPKGAPKKLPELDKLLAEVLGEEKDSVTALEAILNALRAKAARGDINAAKLLLDRAYGQSKQTIAAEVTNKFDASKYTAEEILFLAEMQQKSEPNANP